MSSDVSSEVGGFLEAPGADGALINELILLADDFVTRLHLRHTILLGHALQKNLLGQSFGRLRKKRFRVIFRRRNEQRFTLFGSFPTLRYRKC